MKRQTEEFFGIKRDVKVIHNFVNCDLYKPDPGTAGRREDESYISRIFVR